MSRPREQEDSIAQSEKKKHTFDKIAPLYGLFYAHQKRSFRRLLYMIKQEVDLSTPVSAVDVGCGTGALCAVLDESGYDVTGVDISLDMLAIAKKKKENQKVTFVRGDVLSGLPFADKQFDTAFLAHVVHGFSADDRSILYEEVKRITRREVFIHEFNDRRCFVIDLVEKMEGSDYHGFIEQGYQEMTGHFSTVSRLKASRYSTLYIGRP